MKKQPKPDKKLIILIEDDETMLTLLTRALQKAGYLVKTAKDGASGLLQIRDLKPDLVLLDIILPKLGGFGVLEALYKGGELPNLPVIIISNSGQPVEIERATKLGVRDYLIKVNFSPEELLEKVEPILKAEDAQVSPPASREQNHVSILLVEDDKFLVELLARKFQQHGYRLFSALDANEARRVLETNPIHLILLDIVLPGMDGFTFLSEIKSHPSWKDIPVIILSNLGQKEEIEKGFRGGADDYIVKAHATTEEILKKAEALLEKKSKHHKNFNNK